MSFITANIGWFIFQIFTFMDILILVLWTMNIYEHEKLTRLNLYLANYVFGSTKYGAFTQSTLLSTNILDF